MEKQELEKHLLDITASRFVAEITKRLEEKGLDGIEAELIENEDGTYNGIVEVKYNLTFSKENQQAIIDFKQNGELEQ